MTRHLHAVLVCCLVVVTRTVGGAPVSNVQKPDAEGFIPLFDGKSLDGWEGNVKLWKVEDGMLVGDSPGIKHNEFLCTKDKFGDFELRVEFRLVKGAGNSGIQFRTKRIPNHTEVSGYQADVGEGWWGCLYDESRRNRVLARPDAEALAKVLKKDGWNTYVVRAKGNHITIELNGLKTVDYTEKDEGIAAEGIIAVQIHSGGPMRVEFKSVRIRKL